MQQNNRKDPVHGQIISEWFNPYEFLSRHAKKPAALGQVSAKATLNGSPWSGNIDYNIVGPSRVIMGFAVPGSTSNLPGGQYTVSYNSGGPPNSYLANISPSQTQTLTSNASITFTLNFSTNAGGGVPVVGWEFNSKGNFEGWRTFNTSGTSVSSGILFIDPAGLDPFIVGPDINVDAGTYRYVQMRLASNAQDRYGNIYFKTRSENYYSDDKRVEFTVSNCPPSSCGGNASFATRSIYVGGHAKWRGVITGIRIDPANNGLAGTNKDTIGFDYIRLSNTQ